jgi:protein involved in polysaccharide export with SLBB domain
MKPGKGWSCWKKNPAARAGPEIGPRLHAVDLRLLPLLLTILIFSGCASSRGGVEKNLMFDRFSTNRGEGVVEHYLVRFPDELEATVVGHPEITGVCMVGLDGCIDLGPIRRLRVEGKSPPEIAQLIAHTTGAPRDKVQVRVADYRSQVLILFGQVVGWQRTVPYLGQETVLDLLQRVGGITPDAAPGEVYVVRSHIIDGQRPEIFHVDLNAIVLRKDERTNIRLMPFDQIYVGETRRARLLKCFPRWMHPLLHPLLGTRPANPDGMAKRG